MNQLKLSNQRGHGLLTDLKVFEFMSSLSTIELNRFKKFVESPYFNVNNSVIKLNELIINQLKSKSSHNYSKLEIWVRIYFDKKYDEKSITNLCAELLILGESFLAIEQYLKSPLSQANDLLMSIHQKQIEGLFNSTQSKARSFLEKFQNKSSLYYLHKFNVERNIYTLLRFEESRAQKTIIEKVNINEVLDNLEIFYISEKLKYTCAYLSWNKMTKLNFSVENIDDLLIRAQQNKYNNIPPIAIYLRVFRTLTDEPNEENYLELKSLIQKHIHHFPLDEGKEIFDYALNYALRQVNNGNDKYLNESFELYKHSIELGTIYVNGELTPWTLKNIASMAIRLKEFEWVENFIKSNSQLVKEKFRKNVINFNLANLHWHKKEFNKVLKLVQNIEFDELFYALWVRLFTSTSYYELKEFDTLSFYLESFRTYIMRNKTLAKNRKDPYLLFIRYFKSILDLQNASIEKLKKFRQVVANSGAIPKEWLLEKIDELM